MFIFTFPFNVTAYDDCTRFAELPPLVNEPAIFAVYQLNSSVASIGDLNDSILIDRHVMRVVELQRSLALETNAAAIGFDELPILREMNQSLPPRDSNILSLFGSL